MLLFELHEQHQSRVRARRARTLGALGQFKNALISDVFAPGLHWNIGACSAGTNQHVAALKSYIDVRL